jgi:lipopolysaccharide export system protein LptA
MVSTAMQVPCLMKKLLLPLLCCYLAAMPWAHAEKADRDQPMNIEADALRYDDARQVSVFTGKVLLTKGTIQIRGERVEVRQDPQGFQYGVVTAAPGSLAFFRQKREGVDEYIEGQGQSIDYNGRTEVVQFIGQAQLRRYQGAKLNDEFNAGVIVYNNATDVFTLDGAPAPGKGGSLGQPGAPSGRVRAMISPKRELPAGEPAPASVLRTTPSLKTPKSP